MTDSNLVVISIMCRSDLDSSRAELHVNNYRVRDNRESAIDKRVDGKFTMKVLQISHSNRRHAKGSMGAYRVSRVIRMYCNCSVAEHGFRSGGGNDNLFLYEGL